MFFIYNSIVILTSWLLIPVSWFNKKIKLFLDGRKETFNKLEVIKKTDQVIWFHCASLGEFEQGRPIIERFKTQNTTYKIVVTFFSPSGYEIRKDYKFADVVCYLPLDSKKNARKFLEKVNPKIAVFVKYEFWPNILSELKIKNIKTILVSAIFRENQAFFKNGIIGRFMKKSLLSFNHFFVQDQQSKTLLNSINLENISVSGDTRFDSVTNITKQNNKIGFVDRFIQKKDNFVLVAGSTWKKDEELLINYINNHATKNEQFIIAPHNINPLEIKKLKKEITKNTILYSEKSTKKAQVLIVDTIGILSKIYSYATVAFVGGGFGAGIHNILEPATFGVPVIIGPNYNKFKEAKDLIKTEGCFVVNTTVDFTKQVELFKEKTYLENAQNVTKNYILNNVGATLCIISYIKKNILNFASTN